MREHRSIEPSRTLASRVAHLVACLVLLGPGVASPLYADPQRSPATPVFSVDVPNPTADKPQSKLWYARGCWWACLRARDGNQIWKRSPTGWVRGDTVDPPMRGLHGHGDVYADGDRVRAVLVSSQALVVVALRYDCRQAGYVRDGTPITWPMPADQSVETATITKDRTGRWWVAYDAQGSVWVRASMDCAATCWTEPNSIGCGTRDDDICAIARLPWGIGVIWSNQNTDAVLFRFHRDGYAPDAWDPVETVAQGGKTADDHLNTAVAEDGTLYVATKTSLDTPGEPLFSLRERLPSGRWQSHAYATLLANARPTRPIALLSHDPPRLVLCHTLAGAVEGSSIVSLVSPRPSLDLRGKEIEIIPPTKGLNNVTGCKSPLPPNAPAIVLASDGQGRVYEAIVDLAR